MMSIITFRFAEYYPTQPQYKAIRHTGLAILRSKGPEIMHMLVVNLLGSGDVHVCLWTGPPLMMTSSNLIETFFALLALCEGKPPVDSPHKGPWRGVLMFSLICAWTNSWANDRDAVDLKRSLRRHCNWLSDKPPPEWWVIVKWHVAH